MGWLLMIKGVVAILAVTALGLYANNATYRRAIKQNRREEQHVPPQHEGHDGRT